MDIPLGHQIDSAIEVCEIEYNLGHNQINESCLFALRVLKRFNQLPDQEMICLVNQAIGLHPNAKQEARNAYTTIRQRLFYDVMRGQ